jgi:hypothetical protein
MYAARSHQLRRAIVGGTLACAIGIRRHRAGGRFMVPPVRATETPDYPKSVARIVEP